MHISFLTSEYPFKEIKSAGIGNYIKNLCIGLSENNVNVTVFIYGQKEDKKYTDGDIKLILIKQKKYKFCSWLFNRKRIQKIVNKEVEKAKIDVIEAPEWTGITAFMKFKIPLVLRLHGSDTYFCHLEERKQKRKNFWFEKLALSRADYIVSVSKFTSNLTKELFRINKPIKVIYNGVDMAQFNPNNLNESSNSILYFGTIIPKKGVLELAHIFNEVIKKNENAKLLLLGKDVVDSKTKSSTRKLFLDILSAKAIKNVEFISEVPYKEVKEYLAKISVVVLPSFAEAFPMTWLEAMAQGKALVTSDIGWAKELMINGETGFMENPRNHDEYAEKICELLKKPDLRKKVGLNASERIRKKFSMSVIVQENLNFFKSVITKK